MPSYHRFAAFLPALVCALTLSAAASAHDPPKGLGLVFASEAADALPIVLTNRGLLFPDGEEQGASYSLRCNEAYGVSTAVVPSVLRGASKGALVLATPASVSTTRDRGCTFSAGFSQTDGAAIGGFVASEPPGTLLLSTVDPDHQSKLHVSDDYGDNWSERAVNEPSELYTGLLASPSDAQRVYAVGYHYDKATLQVTSLWARSSDGGKTWQERELSARLTLVGVHPTDPDVVFAHERADELEMHVRVLRSDDAGETFTPVLEVETVTSFASAPDGSVLWLGAGRDGGLYRSSDAGKTFTRVAEQFQSVDCLRHRAGALWLCGNQVPNLDGLWKSSDDGASFDEVLTFDRVLQPVACEGEAAEICRKSWLDWEREIFPDGIPGEADGGAVLDAGTPYRADAGSSHSGRDDAGAGADKPSGSSGCALGASAAQGTTGSTLLGLALLALLRRRARFQSR